MIMKKIFFTIVRIGLVIALINLLLAVGAPLARISMDIAPMKAFPVFIQTIRIGLLLAACGLLFTIISAFMKHSPGVKSALAMIVLGILPLGSVIATVGPGRFNSPMIHDITTDMVNPPEFNKLMELRTPGENPLEYGGEETAVQQRTAYPDIKPIFTSLDHSEALTRAVEVAGTLDWTLINVDSDNGVIEAYDTTRLFGFTDDVIIRIQPDGNGSKIDIRSVSRIGLGDIGMNATRIRQFIKTFNN